MTMIDIVRSAYVPSDFYSKVAKRTCRRFLFFRPRLDWCRTIGDFLEEYATVEDNVGYILEATRELVREFLARLICRLRRMGQLSEAEQAGILGALRRASSVPDVRSERAQALILKACLELGRQRVRFHPAHHIGSDYRRRILTVEQIIVMSIDSRSPNPGPGAESELTRQSKVDDSRTEPICDLTRLRSIPEYHLAEASHYAFDPDYSKAVKEISLDYDSLDEAFSDITAKTPRSEQEDQFASKYTRMADFVEHTFK